MISINQLTIKYTPFSRSNIDVHFLRKEKKIERESEEKPKENSSENLTQNDNFFIFFSKDEILFIEIAESKISNIFFLCLKTPIHLILIIKTLLHISLIEYSFFSPVENENEMKKELMMLFTK